MGVVKNKIIGIYGIYFENDLIYLGQSVNIYERWSTHKRELINNKHHCKSFQEWFIINEINIEKLELRVIEAINELDKIKLYELELKYFNTFKPKCWTIKPNIGFTPEALTEEELKEYNLKKSLKKNELYHVNYIKYKDTIYDLYVNEKKTLPLISEELNISYSLVRKISHELNIVRSHFQNLSKGEWASWSEEDIKKYLINLIDTYSTWPQRAKIAGVSITAIRERCLYYGLFTPEKVKTYKEVVDEFGEDYLKTFIKDNYLDGNENIQWLCNELNCTRKNVYTLIERIDLKVSPEEIKNRINRKNSVHKYSINCSYCNELFNAKAKHAKYCSNECIYNSKLIKHICKYCAKEYLNTSKVSEYCSRKCSYEYNTLTKDGERQEL